MTGTKRKISRQPRLPRPAPRKDLPLKPRPAHHSSPEELEDARHDLESFCYSVSHDLRAPLRCIDGFSSALLHEFGESLEPPARDYLKRIIDSTRKMSSFIDELLVLSRIQRAEMSPQRLDLSAIATNIITRLRSAQPDRKVQVTIAPGLQAHGDERLITTLLQRLLDNAWKFTSKTERPRISFGPCTENNGAFVIRDNGAGFNPTYQPKLFKIFQRLHSHADFPGIGAGLAIARAIVQRHGGKIWAESGHEPGAKFFFTLH